MTPIGYAHVGWAAVTMTISPSKPQATPPEESYRYRRPPWLWPAFFIGIAAMFTAVVYATGGATQLALISAAAVTILAVVYGLTIARLGTWESRVERGGLSFRRPRDRGWVVVEAVELDQVIELFDDANDRDPGYELVLRNGTRTLLDRRLIGRDKKQFRRALLAANPGIRFDRRNERHCYACGADLRVRTDRCPQCDTPIPAPVPRAHQRCQL